MNKTTYGHLIAVFTIVVWGITFTSTKVILDNLLPVEILFSRFLLGAIAMFVIYPKLMGFAGFKRELTFAIAGLFGVSLYFLLENIALTFTLTSNVGVIIAVSPFFTALINAIFIRDEKLQLHFFIGFLIAIAGIYMMSVNSEDISFNPKGDFLALLAAISWSVYSIFIKKASSYGYNNLLVTRKVFCYGLVFIVPALYMMDASFDTERYFKGTVIFNLLFLGLIASALCFFSWNVAVKTLGVVKTSAYIYGIPVVTVITAILILDEKITLLSFVGIVLTLAGLIISESYEGIKLYLKQKLS